jgi:formate dehydrogenase iron-sulfur subunit
MELGSLCAMGGMTPNPVRSVMTHFDSALSVQQAAQEVTS